MTTDKATVIKDTRLWLERAVIGLNLCPFARAPWVRNQVHFEVSAAETPDALLDDLIRALQEQAAADPTEIETTLLIHPRVMQDFRDFNDFLALAEQALEALNLVGVLQIASFHPDYQFAGTRPGDVENCTNRSPYPIIHLLRESSVEWAVDTMEDTDVIYEANIARLRELGMKGWKALMKG
ncbi:DUF1415 domain-containing protein [Marinobacter sp.]|uniref:DUF1415 domain-containing protein n=1 Tax=Marinobacter sp. TaxID=50741 RepID=UPI003850A9DD